ncbi:hypothetical protein SESBI_08041 [Sesbania bispinosa]|nr:hypothetical protein SESBI_08041 [Sesbania bispinosa]
MRYLGPPLRNCFPIRNDSSVTPHSLLDSNFFLSPNACGIPDLPPETVNTFVSSHCACMPFTASDASSFNPPSSRPSHPTLSDGKPYMELKKMVGRFDGSLILTLDSKIREDLMEKVPILKEVKEGEGRKGSRGGELK